MSDLSAAAVESHCTRSSFERWGLRVILAIVVVTFLVVVFGILYPPPSVWGAEIVKRASESSGLILDLLGSIGSVVGVTMARGHMDERLKAGS